MLTYFIETSQYKPTYRDSMPKTVTCLSTQLRLSHLFGMPYEDILSFVKGLDWPQLYYYAYVCWKIPGKVRKNHMGFWLESNETSLECKSKDNVNSERNFTTIKITILLQAFSFLECSINHMYSGILFRVWIRISVLQNIACVTWSLAPLSPSTILCQFSILYRYIFYHHHYTCFLLSWVL